MADLRSWGFWGERGNGEKLTLLVGCVADLGDAAGDGLDETGVGADAFRVEVARVGDRIDRAVLLRDRKSVSAGRFST